MAVEQYVPIVWVNGTTPAINDTNLNHIEQGIKNATDAVTEIQNNGITSITIEAGTIQIINLVAISQANYDLLAAPVATTLYLIKG